MLAELDAQKNETKTSGFVNNLQAACANQRENDGV
jgi:hypothetical protein